MLPSSRRYLFVRPKQDGDYLYHQSGQVCLHNSDLETDFFVRKGSGNTAKSKSFRPELPVCFKLPQYGKVIEVKVQSAQAVPGSNTLSECM